MSDKIRWRDAKALREENGRLRELLRRVDIGCRRGDTSEHALLMVMADPVTGQGKPEAISLIDEIHAATNSGGSEIIPLPEPWHDLPTDKIAGYDLGRMHRSDD